MAPRNSVTIIEVGPRDGLQNISEYLSAETKLSLIQRLHQTGLNTIELTSIVSPRAVPQLRDYSQVLKHSSVKDLLRNERGCYPVLVPNFKGLELAKSHGVKHIAVFVSATEGFSRANTNRTVAQGIEMSSQVAKAAIESNIAVRGYLSCIFADPYEGKTSQEAVLRGVKALLDMGCYQVSLGDTLGVGTPQQVRSLLAFLFDNGVPPERLAGHFHDTYGQALANVWQAYQCGIRAFDSSVAGLGGCPFAPGAKGNVATEDVVYMFENAGVHTGVDLMSLVQVGDWISRKLNKPNGSRAGVALAQTIKKSSNGQVEKDQVTKPRSLVWEPVKELNGVLVHRSGVNLRLTMNRPKNGNCLTASMIDDITSEVRRAGTDSSVRRVIISGEGKFFCTGMDLSKDNTAVGSDDTARDAQFKRLTTLLETIDQCPKLTIACVNGPAFGGGIGLAFACDLRIAVKTAHMTLSEVKLGICAATISKYIIREWGPSFAREAMLTARPVSPLELQQRGIIMAVAEDHDGLAALLDATLGSLRVASPAGTAMSKKLVSLGWADGGTERQDRGIRSIFDDMMKPGTDGEFGVREFQNGRKVDWDARGDLVVRSKL